MFKTYTLFSPQGDYYGMCVLFPLYGPVYSILQNNYYYKFFLGIGSQKHNSLKNIYSTFKFHLFSLALVCLNFINWTQSGCSV